MELQQIFEDTRSSYNPLQSEFLRKICLSHSELHETGGGRALWAKRDWSRRRPTGAGLGVWAMSEVDRSTALGGIFRGLLDHSY